MHRYTLPCQLGRDTLWLVKIDGNGFFIPGQEPCWLLPHVADWLEQIFPT